MQVSKTKSKNKPATEMLRKPSSGLSAYSMKAVIDGSFRAMKV